MTPKRAPTFQRIFIANRGEAAVRVARACDALGITPVFAVSEADKDAAYVRDRETALLGGARSSESYLHMVRIIEAAKKASCSALHPGWGFLSENPRFAMLCLEHGITFLGPPPHVMALMGQKTPAKNAMRKAGLTLIPGSDGILESADHAQSVADAIGYPVLLKAESGGGGRGMRIARSSSEVRGAFEDATAEATSAFGDPRVFMEKLIEHGRHIEIQLMADKYGNVVHLGERDCTIQRNHQKLIEESPSPVLSAAERERTLEAAVRATQSIGYVGAGTMEFLLDETGTLRFMEMNTRLQVEHCVSEMRTGIDLVKEQIYVGSGQRLGFSQSDITPRGHAIECRINAEDPNENFKPSPGLIKTWTPPSNDDGNLRVDTHVTSGYEVPPFYDSLLAKFIAYGETREQATARMVKALDELVCDGVPTTAPMHRQILTSEAFAKNDYTTRTIPGFTPKA